jgi:hypothetical protein
MSILSVSHGILTRKQRVGSCHLFGRLILLKRPILLKTVWVLVSAAGGFAGGRNFASSSLIEPFSSHGQAVKALVRSASSPPRPFPARLHWRLYPR